MLEATTVMVERVEMVLLLMGTMARDLACTLTVSQSSMQF